MKLSIEINKIYTLPDGEYKLILKRGLNVLLENNKGGLRKTMNLNKFKSQAKLVTEPTSTPPPTSTAPKPPIPKLEAEKGKSYYLKDEKIYTVLSITKGIAALELVDANPKVKIEKPTVELNEQILYWVDLDARIPVDTVGREAFIKLDDMVERRGKAFDTKFVEAANGAVYDGALYEKLKSQGRLRFVM